MGRSTMLLMGKSTISMGNTNKKQEDEQERNNETS
jgi:hypothetical protein